MAILLNAPQKIADEHYLLRIETGPSAPVPGQFVNIRVGAGMDPLLRRPFSIFDYGDGIMEIVIRTVGRGTRMLANAEPGPIDLIGPLGKGFTIAPGRVILVGGGVGNAPLLFLARALREQGAEVLFIYGTRSASLCYLTDRFRRHASRLITVTDDGTEGRHGLVTDILREVVGEGAWDRIYTCGPQRMMEGVVDTAGTIPVEVSVENYFGCGVGLCAGCTVETTAGYRRACVDGPVFNGTVINWKTMPQ